MLLSLIVYSSLLGAILLAVGVSCLHPRAAAFLNLYQILAAGLFRHRYATKAVTGAYSYAVVPAG